MPARPSPLLLRVPAALLLAALLAVLTAGPAWAHGAGGADVSNYASRVTGIAAGLSEDGTPAGPAAPVDGVSWRVLANDALLEVENATDREIVVDGYNGEPYLRVGPDGVFENRRSPAAYLNADRYGEVPVPVGADPDAEPDWVRVGDGPVHAWHDHRIHWMAATEPPQVKAAPDQEHVVLEWGVPFRLGDEERAVAGVLRWVPGPPAWPWVLAAAVLLSVPVAVALARGGGRARLLRAASAVLVAVVVLDVVHAVDDLVSVPATAGEIAVEAARVAVFVAVAAFGAWRGSRDDGTALPAVVVGAVALLAGMGLPDTAALSASQLTGTLPAAFSRVAVAANLAVVLPVGVAAALAARDRRTDEAPVAAETPSAAVG